MILKEILPLASLFSLVLPACSTTRELRDRSQDNPKLVSQIQRVANSGKSVPGAVQCLDPKKISPYGSATYRNFDVFEKEYSIIETQVYSDKSNPKLVWQETKQMSSGGVFVNKLGMLKLKNGYPDPTRVVKFFTWNDEDNVVTDHDAQMLNNFTRGALAANQGAAESEIGKESQAEAQKKMERRDVKVPAGSFRGCGYQKTPKSWLADESEVFYANGVGPLGIVYRKSGDFTLELVSYSSRAKGISLLPSHVKIVVEERTTKPMTVEDESKIRKGTRDTINESTPQDKSKTTEERAKEIPGNVLSKLSGGLF